MPDEVDIEARIAEQEMEAGELIASVDRIGKISKLTCPDCHGALWEIHDDELLRYRWNDRRVLSRESRSDEQDRILTINAAARRLLGVHDLAYDQDFLHAVRGMPYQEVRRAIDTTFREHTTMTLPELGLERLSESSGKYVSFTIMLMQAEQGAPDLAVITALDATEQVQLKRRVDAMQREHADLVGELGSANKRLGTMNQELQDANEELQAANEELMLAQEELQATNEEFEATNEELQATNEELQTTNDELSARTVELQEMTKQHRMEQLQLSALLERFPHYVMVLNAEDLTIQAVNPAYQKILDERNVTGLSLPELFSGKQVDELINVIKAAITEAQSYTTGPIFASLDSDRDPARYIHTIVPISDISSVITRLFIYSERAEGWGG